MCRTHCARCFRGQASVAQVLDAASLLQSLMQEPKLQTQVLGELQSFDPEVQRAALRVALRWLRTIPIGAGSKGRVCDLVMLLRGDSWKKRAIHNF